MQTNQTAHYTATAKGLHWLMALGIFSLFALGLYMADLHLSPLKLKLYSWHKWGGVSIFMLALLRLLWRATHRPPALPAHMSTLEQWLAHAGHAFLYLLMFAIPLTGWLMSSAKGVQTVYFGLWPMPDLLSKDKALGDGLHEVHETLNWILALVVAGHALVALKHHLINHDNVLVRMLPGPSGKVRKCASPNI